MYIDTHTKEGMEESICNIFEISKSELTIILQSLIINKHNYDYESSLNDLIINKSPFLPNEVLFYHLSRRLNGTNDISTVYNLCDLLTTENEISEFFHNHEIKFLKGEQHIDVIYKGNLIDWDRCYKGNASYMKLRLGYFVNREDFCINGFALKDLIYKNNYTRSLFNAPEFISQLAVCLNLPSLINNYMDSSTYYCFEYKIPIENIIFDGNDSFSNIQKKHHIIKCVLQRLIEYQSTNINYIFDHSNPVLRLPDNYNLSSEYYIDKNPITYDML